MGEKHYCLWASITDGKEKEFGGSQRGRVWLKCATRNGFYQRQTKCGVMLSNYAPGLSQIIPPKLGITVFEHKVQRLGQISQNMSLHHYSSNNLPPWNSTNFWTLKLTYLIFTIRITRSANFSDSCRNWILNCSKLQPVPFACAITRYLTI